MVVYLMTNVLKLYILCTYTIYGYLLTCTVGAQILADTDINVKRKQVEEVFNKLYGMNICHLLSCKKIKHHSSEIFQFYFHNNTL